MSKKERDKDLDEFMNEIRKSDVMHLDSISILKEVVLAYKNEKLTYNHLISAYQFLGTVRKYYKSYRFVYRIKYHIYMVFQKK